MVMGGKFSCILLVYYSRVVEVWQLQWQCPEAEPVTMAHARCSLVLALLGSFLASLVLTTVMEVGYGHFLNREVV